MLNGIRCSLYRGGTSKAAFFLEDDLPASEAERAVVFQKIMGGNDPAQIDGLGGAKIVTSKVAVVARSRRSDCDLDYTFIQVFPNWAGLDYGANCGNISSAVGMFAIEKKLIIPRGDRTTIKIFNTNTKRVIYETVETPGQSICYEGDYSIAGVPGTGSKVELRFEYPSGAITGSLLPTGNAADSIYLPGGGSIDVSVLDCTSLFVFVPMDGLSLSGGEMISQIEGRQELLENLEYIRGEIACRLGMVSRPEDAAKLSPAMPKIAVVGRPADYRADESRLIPASEMDIRACMMTMGKPHRSFAVTGAMCLCAATAVKGSVAYKIFHSDRSAYTLRLGNPAGIIESGIDIGRDGKPSAVTAYRTARLLMSGTAYYTT